ncbi:cyclophilin-like fold protein [Deinococcus radiotolerans]|nr:cyclophilin-like fold protein [Deinococcus radiotolerans]
MAGLFSAYSEAAVRGHGRQQVQVRIGQTTFTATLDRSAAAQAFTARLPLTLKMTDLHRNEKFADLTWSLPVKATKPGTVRSGDLLLYGSKTVVLFYETFPTAYSYTRLGRIDDPQGLAQALGPGNVTVTFSVE